MSGANPPKKRLKTAAFSPCRLDAALRRRYGFVMTPRLDHKARAGGLRLAVLLLALLVQILAPAGAQISMARAMQSGAAPLCGEFHQNSPRRPDHQPSREASCCGLCGLVHAGATPPGPTPTLAPRAAPKLVAPFAPPDQLLALATPHALRPPARASPLPI